MTIRHSKTYSSHRYLVDTNILIDILRGQALVERLLADCMQVSGGHVYITDVTVAEIYSGTREKDLMRTEVLVKNLRFEPISFHAAKQAGEYRFEFARKGIKLSLADSLIAGLAKTEDLILVTRNKKHFPMTDIELIS